MDLHVGNLDPNGDNPNPNLIPNLNLNGDNPHPNGGNPNPNPNPHVNPNPNPEPNQGIPNGEMGQVTQAIQRLGERTDNQIAQLMMMITGVARRLPNPNPNPNPRGLYCYNVMPFGLRNAGATYQRLATIMLKKLLSKTMEVYIDDMVVKSKEKENHVVDLRRLLRY